MILKSDDIYRVHSILERRRSYWFMQRHHKWYIR